MTFPPNPNRACLPNQEHQTPPSTTYAGTILDGPIRAGTLLDCQVLAMLIPPVTNLCPTTPSITLPMPRLTHPLITAPSRRNQFPQLLPRHLVPRHPFLFLPFDALPLLPHLAQPKTPSPKRTKPCRACRHHTSPLRTVPSQTSPRASLPFLPRHPCLCTSRRDRPCLSCHSKSCLAPPHVAPSENRPASSMPAPTIPIRPHLS